MLKFQIHSQLLQKQKNEFQPFLYNDIIDLCDFIKNQKRNILWNFVYETTKRYSNLNHSCPVNVIL